MPGISKKRLDQVRKTMELAFGDDEASLDAITKGLDGLQAAIEKGETVTAADLSDILGEVVVEKAVTAPAGTETSGEQPEDPIAPIFKSLYEAVFEADGTIKKGLKAETAQEIFQKHYESAVAELDGAIEGAVEATAVEFGKARKPAAKEPDPDHDDDEGYDMEKMLKAAGLQPALIKKVGDLQSKVNALEADKALTRFTKMATDMGEAAEFGKTLMALSDADPKAFEDIVKRLTAKNALLKKSATWSKEIGEGGLSAEGATALSQLTGHAEELRKTMKNARGAPVSFAKAFTEACTLHPDLYGEYQRERKNAA